MKDLSNENVIHIKKNGIEYLQFRRLLEYKDIINHAYSLGLDKDYRTARAKEKPQLPEEEYNKSLSNYKQLCEELKINYINIVKPNQNHTKNVLKVEEKINSNAPDFNLKQYDDTDGLVTKNNKIVLATTNADCILLLFFDPIKKVIANVHSGWKGTLQRISVEAVNKMKNEYNCKLEDLICCICPSIRKCHFEVREDVQKPYYEEFKNLQQIDKLIKKIPNTDKWKIDTVEINKMILIEAGLKPENIIDSGICSVCNSDVMHSYRVEKEKYGLNTALIEMK